MRAYDWIIAHGFGMRTASHAAVAVVLTALWLWLFPGESPWFAVAIVGGHYGLREVEDVLVKDQHYAEGIIEFLAPVIVSATIAAIAANGGF